MPIRRYVLDADELDMLLIVTVLAIPAALGINLLLTRQGRQGLRIAAQGLQEILPATLLGIGCALLWRIWQAAELEETPLPPLAAVPTPMPEPAPAEAPADETESDSRPPLIIKLKEVQ